MISRNTQDLLLSSFLHFEIMVMCSVNVPLMAVPVRNLRQKQRFDRFQVQGEVDAGQRWVVLLKQC